MSIVDLFSKRQKRQRGEMPDVYQYENIPDNLRIQIIHITRQAFVEAPPFEAQILGKVHEILCSEYGRFQLAGGHDNSDDVLKFLMSTDDVEKVIDVIELIFKGLLNLYHDQFHFKDFTKGLTPAEIAISELNTRFRESGVGYQFESGQIIRVDSQIIHSEIMKPALQVLSKPQYKGANQEFLNAHSHYRAGKNKECLNECLKAFESTVKAICHTRKWHFQPGDTAKGLLDLVFTKGLIPEFFQNHFTGLRATLEAGVPTVRNKLAGHGQGLETVTVPESIAAYALHLTATNIVFLAKAESEMK